MPIGGVCIATADNLSYNFLDCNGADTCEQISVGVLGPSLCYVAQSEYIVRIHSF